MADTYANFAALAAANLRGRDYEIDSRTGVGTGYGIHIAIHGGAIESPTTQLAQYCAGSTGAYYAFSGIKSSGNTALHITSTHFDEPTALALVASSAYTISWHGTAGASPVSYVGGADLTTAAAVIANLEAAGFLCAPPSSPIAGVDPANICNRNLRRSGVQIEISLAQRQAFFLDGSLSNANVIQPGRRTQAFYRYANAVVEALSAAVAPQPLVPRDPSVAPGAPGARQAGVAVQMRIPFALAADGSVAVVQDEAQAVSDRVRALVGTVPGDRVMRADYGVPTTDVLFAGDVDIANAELQLMVRDAVQQYEPTAVVTSVSADLDEDSGTVRVSVGVGRSDVPQDEQARFKQITVNIGGSVTVNPL